MTDLQLILLVLILGFGVWLTRFLPFVIFKNTENLPKAVVYLGKVLPAAMMGLLVIYCLKDYTFDSVTAVLPVAVSILAVVGVHLWKRNTILSISVGTVLYMILIRVL